MPVASMNERSSVAALSSCILTCSISPTTTPLPSGQCRTSAACRPSSTSISVDLPAPLRPTSATRSPYSISRSIGPSRNAPRSTVDADEPGDDVAAASGVGHLESQLPWLARLVDDVQPVDRALRLGGLAGELLGLVDAEAADVLVGLVVHRALDAGDALLRPLALALGAVGEILARRVVLVEALPRVLSGECPLGEVGLPAAAEAVTPCVNSSISTTSVTTRSRNRRSWLTSSTPALEPEHPPLEPGQPVEVEIVGRLVEQVDVESREQQRRQRRSRRLAARERRGRLGEQPGAHAELVGDAAEPGASRSAAPSASQRCQATS